MTYSQAIRRARGAAQLAALAAALLSVTTLSACVTSSGHSVFKHRGDSEALAKAARVHKAQTTAYKTEQDRVAKETTFPLAMQFPGRGSLLVHRVELLGGPESPFLRARFTYVNTTGGPLPIPTIEFKAHAGDDSIAQSSSKRLTRLLDSTIGNDAAHSAWIDLDVDEVIDDPAWSWSFDVVHPAPPVGPKRHGGSKRRGGPPPLSAGRSD